MVNSEPTPLIFLALIGTNQRTTGCSKSKAPELKSSWASVSSPIQSRGIIEQGPLASEEARIWDSLDVYPGAMVRIRKMEGCKDG